MALSMLANAQPRNPSGRADNTMIRAPDKTDFTLGMGYAGNGRSPFAVSLPCKRNPGRCRGFYQFMLRLAYGKLIELLVAAGTQA
jgi:hypothetical protein